MVVRDHQQREPSMGNITTIGLDLAKSVFQVHAVDEMGSVVMRKQLRRSQVLAFFTEIPPCLIGLEACATAHHWARELIALGHEARLMPPNYVKAYVKRNKHDVADAEAICEAVRRPSMRFVPVKTVEQQSALMMHRARDLLIRQRTMLVNALRGHLAEFGLIEAQGLHKVARLITIVMDERDGRIPQGCSTLFTESHGKDGFETAKRCGVAVLGDRIGLVNPQDIVGEAAHSREDAGIFSDARRVFT